MIRHNNKGSVLFPLLIALCGLPQSGKTSVQAILARDHGIVAVDDGCIVREHCRTLFGLSQEDVTTQAGKSRSIRIGETTRQVRDVMGTYARLLEDEFDQNVIANVALRATLAKWHALPVDERPAGYSFGSVRRRQGQVYRDAGGHVIEVIRPGVVSSGYDFDDYEKSCVTDAIINSSSRDALRNEVELLMSRLTLQTIAV